MSQQAGIEISRHDGITYRPPTLEDGSAVWRLVRDLRFLDLNSAYCYVIVCHHYTDTCAVAEADGAIVGFVNGYLPPGRDDTLFIWQIGVSPQRRGQGLAMRLLIELLRRPRCRDVSFVEATVGPSNEASWALFSALSKCLQADLSKRPFIGATMFPDDEHEPENLIRIGPFSPPESRPM